MGVTIHFEGKLRNEAAYRHLMVIARRIAELRGWPIKMIDQPGVTLQRVKDEKDWDYVGPVRGLELQPHENSDPLRLEFDRDFYVQEFVKTQFAPVEVHIAIIEFLRGVSDDFEFLEVEDEAEYWDTSDVTILRRHIDACARAIDERIAADDTAHGPVRLASGRIVDLMTDQER